MQIAGNSYDWLQWTSPRRSLVTRRGTSNPHANAKRIERHPTRFRSRPTGIVKRRSFSVNILPLEDRCELDVCDGWRHRTAG